MLFVGDKIAADNFKYKMITSLKANGGLKFAQDGAMSHVRDKFKPRWKLSHKVFEGQYGYDTLIETSLLPTIIQLKYFLCGIQHCVTFVGNWFLTGILLFCVLSLVMILTIFSLMGTK